jgi:hypothetical protein
MTKEEFKERVFRWVRKMGVVCKMKREWGSCSSTGRICFNEELLEKDDELLHIKFSLPSHQVWKFLKPLDKRSGMVYNDR